MRDPPAITWSAQEDVNRSPIEDYYTAPRYPPLPTSVESADNSYFGMTSAPSYTEGVDYSGRGINMGLHFQDSPHSTGPSLSTASSSRASSSIPTPALSDTPSATQVGPKVIKRICRPPNAWILYRCIHMYLSSVGSA